MVIYEECIGAPAKIECNVLANNEYEREKRNGALERDAPLSS